MGLPPELGWKRGVGNPTPPPEDTTGGEPLFEVTPAEDYEELEFDHRGGETDQRRPWSHIIADLQKRIPPRHIRTKVVKGERLHYVPWYTLMRHLLHKTNGYANIEIVSRKVVDWWQRSPKDIKVFRSEHRRFDYDHEDNVSGTWTYHRALCITVRIHVEAADGPRWTDGDGFCDLEEQSYGDAQSKAKAMAFRRALASWGCGLELWEKEE